MKQIIIEDTHEDFVEVITSHKEEEKANIADALSSIQTLYQEELDSEAFANIYMVLSHYNKLLTAIV